MARSTSPTSLRTERRIEIVRTRPRPFINDDAQVYSIVDQIKSYRRPITAAELGTLLNRSEDVIYAMVRKNKIPALRIPGSKLIQFDPATVVYWLTQHNPILKQIQKAS